MKCMIVCILGGLLLAASVHAEAPRLITYQGVLTDLEGVPVNGSNTLTFTLHADSIGNTPLWEENHQNVEVSHGLFNVILGSIDAFPANLFDADELWLGIQVEGDEQMTPRVKMTSVPWAMRAAVADYAHNSGGGTDNDWSIDGDDMYSAVTGNVGVGETSPLVRFHAQGSEIDLPAGALHNEQMILESGDALLGLYSGTSGSFGSGITLGEISEGALTDKWSVVRTTADDSQLQFRFGPNQRYDDNPTVAALWQEANNSILRLVSTGSDGSQLRLRGSADRRGSVQFLDESNAVDSEINYFHSSSPLIPSSLRFSTLGTRRMVITSSGLVGIGTSDPESRLDVRSDGDTYRGYLGGPTYGAYGINQGTGSWGALGESTGGVVGAHGSAATTGTLGASDCGVIGWHPSGNYGRLGTTSHGVYGHVDSESDFAGYFDGRVRIKGNVDIWNETRKILELGEGLDYAEGFNLTDPSQTEPGTVLAIAPDSQGKLTVCRKAYDTRVAGIAAGARGLQSGVRLGVDGFDCDVALAGRVYCNVDATEHGIEAGDLLTTASLPGYAMKATDPQRSQGAILGKAMESLPKGQKGQILVLVTLQ